jgi:hypothetical protein
MSVMLVTAVLAFGAAEQPAEGKAGSAIEGKWVIVYAEEGGRRNNSWEQRVAVIKGTTLTYEDEGKERSLALKLGPNQTVTATGDAGRGGKTYKGVCVVGQDYLCISLVGGKAKGAGAGGGSAPPGAAEGGREPAERPVARPAPGGGRSSGDFILILRRQRAK